LTLKANTHDKARAAFACLLRQNAGVNSPQTLLAFDFGLARTGVAVGNTVTGGARPLTTIVEEQNDKRFAAIAALIEEWKPDCLLVGLPLHADGSDTDITKRARRFGNQLHGRFGLPVEFADERYSSAVAEDALKPGRGDKQKIDAAAAAVILQAWLDGQANS
jgi:putative Holliday junction resolvase